MPLGASRVDGTDVVTDMTEMSAADLAMEFQDDWLEQQQPEGGEDGAKEEEEGGGEEGKEEMDKAKRRRWGRREKKKKRSTRVERLESSPSLQTSDGADGPAESSPGPSPQSGSMSAMDDERTSHKTQGPSVWQSVKRRGGELNHDTRRFFRYIGRKLHSRNGQRETKVKEIHILPGDDDDQMWARRMAGSANSRSSTSSDTTT